MTCENGQSAGVSIVTKGGGLTAGKSEIDAGVAVSNGPSQDRYTGIRGWGRGRIGAVEPSSVQPSAAICMPLHGRSRHILLFLGVIRVS